MQNNKNYNNNTPANIFFVALFADKAAELFTGVKTSDGRFGPAIILPEIPGMKEGKNIITCDRKNPAKVSAKGKIYNALFQLNGGTKKFSDPQTFATLVKPAEGETKVVIVADKRWDFEGKLAADTSIKCERGTGNPNGSVAPGVMILNDGDSIKFAFEGKNYTITNFDGFAHLVGEKPIIAKKVKEVKPVIEVVADNRVKVEKPGLTVVTKVQLNHKKEVVKPTPVAVVKPVVKKDFTKKKFFKKGPSDNGNHFVPATVAIPDYVPATTGLGSVTGAEKLAAMIAEMEKSTKKKSVGKKAKTTA